MEPLSGPLAVRRRSPPRAAAPSLGALLGAALSACLTALLTGCSGDSPTGCQVLHGTQQAMVTLTSCKSPVGFCTSGTLAGTGIIDGTTTLVPEKEAAAAGLGPDEPATTVSYTGTLTITGSWGALSLHETGLFDTSYQGGLFISRDVVLSGTGTAAGMTGYLIFEGVGTTQFANTLSGEICPP